jgi:hypothetical protein
LSEPLLADPAADWRSPADAELSAAFAAACRSAGGATERTYRIGGQDLCLRCAGEALLDRLTPSIEHLRTEGGTQAHRHVVEIWDGQAGGPPPVPTAAETLPPAGIVTAVADERRAIYQVGVRTLSVVDTRLDRSWYWAADAETLPEWESSTPLRHILHLWLASRGVQFVHAGSVGRPDGGCVIVGRSGSGKSTTTLACLGAGFLYAGDDYVGVSTDEEGGTPRVHSIYGCGKLEKEHAARFPDLRVVPRDERSGALRARRDKLIFYVRDTYPEQLTQGYPLRAIVVPRVAATETTRLTEISLTETLRALVPSTLFEIHAAGQSALSSLTRVARSVPAYELRLGTDISVIPDLIGQALER